jgi:hypothetical protein
MLLRLIPVLAIVMLAVACAPRPALDGGDTEPPRITLTVLNSAGSPTFGSDEHDPGACAVVRGFPASISVSATDEGGVDSLVVSVFPGRISDVGVAPDSADFRTERNRSTDSLIVTPRPPAGLVQPNVVVTLKVSEFSGVVASADDTSGNRGHLHQVDLRPPQTPVSCP